MFFFDLSSNTMPSRNKALKIRLNKKLCWLLNVGRNSGCLFEFVVPKHKRFSNKIRQIFMNGQWVKVSGACDKNVADCWAN